VRSPKSETDEANAMQSSPSSRDLPKRLGKELKKGRKRGREQPRQPLAQQNSMALKKERSSLQSLDEGCFKNRKNVQKILRGEVPKISRQKSGFVPSERTIKDDMIGILPRVPAQARW